MVNLLLQHKSNLIITSPNSKFDLVSIILKLKNLNISQHHYSKISFKLNMNQLHLHTIEMHQRHQDF